MAQNGHLTSLLGSNIEAMRKSAIGLDGTSENKQTKIKTKHNITEQIRYMTAIAIKKPRKIQCIEGKQNNF
jgi:hypothetical protein